MFGKKARLGRAGGRDADRKVAYAVNLLIIDYLY